MIETLLSQVGLNENEAAVYVAILEKGKVAPARVAAITDINRTTVYSVAKKLARLGLISEDLGKNVHYFVAKPPENLRNIFKNEREKIREKEKTADEAVEQLKMLTKNVKFSVPKIQFVEENDLDEFMRRRADSWTQSASEIDKTWWGYQKK